MAELTYYPNSKNITRQIKPGFEASISDVLPLIDTPLTGKTGPSLYYGIMMEGANSKIDIDQIGTVSVKHKQPVLMACGAETSTAGILKASKRYRSVGVNLSLPFVKELAIKYKIDALGDLCHKVDNNFLARTLPPSAKIHQLAYTMISHHESDELAEIEFESCALSLIVEIARSILSEKEIIDRVPLSKNELERAQFIRQILEDNLSNQITLSDLSQTVGINPTTMSVQFQKAFGVSIFTYLRNRRLETARILLQDQKMLISQVGYHVGFRNPAAFTTAYRRYFGHPPSAEQAH